MLSLKFALDPGDRCNPRKIFPVALFPPRTQAAAENRLPRDAAS